VSITTRTTATAPDDNPVEVMRFGSLEIRYNREVLRPRGWTVAQSEWAADLLGRLPAGPVLELCAGVGHIGMLAVADRPRDLVLVDVDPVACAFASHNVGVAGLGARVQLRCGPVEEVIDPTERFALVIADPPWVPSDETDRHSDDPTLAIDGGEDGLEVARLCLTVAAAHLVDGGSMLMQLGDSDQASAIVAGLRSAPDLRLEHAGMRAYDDGGVVLHLVRDVMPRQHRGAAPTIA
jgi:methylase of polypeptide subunit release factors